MINPEQLIADLNKQIEKLSKEVKDLEYDSKFFENAANTWMLAYKDLEAIHKVELGNAEKIIQELDDELGEAKAYIEELEKDL